MKKDNRLILALDVTSREKALSLALQLKGYFDAIKIGYPLILSAGLGIVTEISSFARSLRICRCSFRGWCRLPDCGQIYL